jgi:hypothetical protein
MKKKELRFGYGLAGWFRRRVNDVFVFGEVAIFVVAPLLLHVDNHSALEILSAVIVWKQFLFVL